MPEAPERKEGETVRDIDLLKVKIYADHRRAHLTSLLSFISALCIGAWILWCTLFFQKVIRWEDWILSIIIIPAIHILSSSFIFREYRKEFKNISSIIETIRQGKQLPKLEELGKRKKNRN